MAVIDLKKFKIRTSPDSNALNTLRVGDIVRRQYFDGKNGIYTLMYVFDTGVDNILDDEGVEKESLYFKGYLLYGDEPKSGELLDFVRVTNLTDPDRSGALYLTSSDDESPYMDVVDGFADEHAEYCPIGVGDNGYKAVDTSTQIGYKKHSKEGRRVATFTNKGSSTKLGMTHTDIDIINDGVWLVTFRISANKATKATLNISSELSEDANHIFDVNEEHKEMFFPVTSKDMDVFGRTISLYSELLEAKDDYLVISDFTIVKLSTLNVLSGATKSRVGKLDGIIDPSFGKLEGHGAYFQRLYVTQDANIAGTVIAGDIDGSSSTFYAGKIHKNMLINSLGINFIDNEGELVEEISPVGIGNVYKVSKLSADMLVQSKKWSEDNYGKQVCFSVYVKVDKDEDVNIVSNQGESIVQRVFKNDGWTRIFFDFIILGIEDLIVSIPNKGILFTAPQLEYGNKTTPYQPTDQTLDYTNEYGAWMSRGGIGGTIQNPLVKLNEDGSIESRGDGFKINNDGSGHLGGGAIQFSGDRVEINFGDTNIGADVGKIVDGKIDDLEIGGRNLFRRYSNEQGSILASSGINISAQNRVRSVGFIELDSTTLTANMFRSGYGMFLYAYDESKQYILGSFKNIIHDSEPVIVSFPSAAKYMRYVISNEKSFLPQDLYEEKIKIEFGNKPTDWTPAPEDMATNERVNSIETNFEIKEGQIASSVKEVREIGSKVEVAHTDVVQMSDKISSQVERVSKDAESVSRDKTLVEQTASGVKTIAEQVKEDAGKVASDKTSVEQTAQSIKSTAEKVASDAKSVSNNKTSIEQTASSVKSLATEVQTNAKEVSTKHSEVSQKAGEVTILAKQAKDSADRSEKAEASINLKADGIVLEASNKAAEKAIDGLEIGGRNLIVRHSERKGWMIDPDGKESTYQASALMNKSIPVTAGDKLIFQIFETQSGGDNYWRYAYYNNNNVVVKRYANNNTLFHQQVPESAAYMKVSYPKGGTVKLERGTKPTDWSPAPEDMATSGSVTQLESKLTVESGKISAHSSQINKLTKDVDEAKLELAPDRIWAKVSSKTQDAIDDLEIGGRNYWAISKEAWYKPYLMYDKKEDVFYSRVTTNAYAIFRISDLNVELGGNYTVSFEISPANNNVQFQNSNVAINGVLPWGTHNRPTLKIGEWSKVWFTFDYHTYGTGLVHIYIRGLEHFKDFKIRRFKMERGVKPTDWTPAPEDIASREEIESSFEMTSNSISLMSKKISMSGMVTFQSLASGSGSNTIIDGGKIKTNLLDVKRIVADGIEAKDITGLTLDFTKGTIGGWVIDRYNITKNGVSLTSDGSIYNQGKWLLDSNGSGYLASRNISWNTSGDVTFSDSVKMLWMRDINSEISNIQAGGMNLAMRSADFFWSGESKGITRDSMDGYRGYVVNSDNGNYASMIIHTDNTLWEAGETYVFSIDVYYIGDKPRLPRFYTGTTGYQSMSGDIKAARWCRAYQIVTPKDDKYWRPHFGFSGREGKYYFKNIQIEKGNIPSEWSPSPMDDVEISQLGGTVISNNKIRTDILDVVDIVAKGIRAEHIKADFITGKSLTFTRGKIGGWTIGSTKLTGNNIELDSSGGIRNTTGTWALNPNGSAHLGKDSVFTVASDGKVMVGGFQAHQKRLESSDYNGSRLMSLESQSIRFVDKTGGSNDERRVTLGSNSGISVAGIDTNLLIDSSFRMGAFGQYGAIIHVKNTSTSPVTPVGLRIALSSNVNPTNPVALELVGGVIDGFGVSVKRVYGDYTITKDDGFVFMDNTGVRTVFIPNGLDIPVGKRVEITGLNNVNVKTSSGQNNLHTESWRNSVTSHRNKKFDMTYLGGNKWKVVND